MKIVIFFVTFFFQYLVNQYASTTLKEIFPCVLACGLVEDRCACVKTINYNDSYH